MPEGRSRSARRALDREPGGEYGRRHYMSAQTLLAARRGESRFYTDIADGLRAVCRTDMEALAAEDQCDEYAPAFEHKETRVALCMGSPSVAVTRRPRAP